MTQLSFTGGCGYVEPSYDGNSFYYRYQIPGTFHGFIADFDGLIQDTIPNMGTASWGKNNVYAIAGFNDIRQYSDANPGYVTLLEWEEGPGCQVQDVQWNNPRQLIYFSKYLNGLYQYDYLNKTVIQIKDSWTSNWYQALSCSDDGTQILFQKVQSKVQNQVQLVTKSEIWLMDANGCNERRILPEL